MYEPTNALYCPNCGKEVYPASEPCKHCGYHGGEEFDDVVVEDGPDDPQGCTFLLNSAKHDQLAAEFNKRYNEAKTWKEADELIQTLPPAERTKLFEALKRVKAFMGLDMRQEFYMTILRHSNV